MTQGHREGGGRIAASGPLAAACALALALAAAHARAADPSSVERELDRLFRERQSAPGIELRLAPGDLPADKVGQLAEALGAARKTLLERLELPDPGLLKAYVHRDAAALGALLGHSADGPVVREGIAHIPLDAPDPPAAMALLLEPLWGRTGGFLGGTLEGGRTYRIELRVAQGRVELDVDDAPIAALPLSNRSGAIGFGASGGTLRVSDLKVRKDATEGWVFPLKSAKALTWPFALAGDALEASAGPSLARWIADGTPLAGFQLRCELVRGPGATVEVVFHAGLSGVRAVRFGPAGAWLVTREGDDPERRELLTGPHPSLRRAFAAWASASAAGRAPHREAKALLDAGELADLSRLIERANAGGDPAERTRAGRALESFARWLIDAEGPSEYRKVHFASLAGQGTPKGSLAELDGRWRKFLKEQADVPPIEMERARRALALDLLAKAFKEVDLNDPRQRRFGSKGTWTPVETGLRWRGPLPGQKGESVGTGFILPTVRAGARFAVRTRIRLDRETKALLVLSSDEQSQKTIFEVSTAGCRLLDPSRRAVSESDRPLAPDRAVELLAAFEGSGARLYVDGELVCEAQAGLASGPGKCALVLNGSEAWVESMAFRDLTE